MDSRPRVTSGPSWVPLDSHVAANFESRLAEAPRSHGTCFRLPRMTRREAQCDSLPASSDLLVQLGLLPVPSGITLSFMESQRFARERRPFGRQKTDIRWIWRPILTPAVAPWGRQLSSPQDRELVTNFVLNWTRQRTNLGASGLGQVGIDRFGRFIGFQSICSGPTRKNRNALNTWDLRAQGTVTWISGFV